MSVRALLLSRPSHVVNVPRDYTGIQSPTSTRRPASRDERPTSEFRHLRFPSSLGDQKPAKLSSRELPRDFGEDKFGFPEWLLSRDRATFARLLSVPQFRSKDTQASHTPRKSPDGSSPVDSGEPLFLQLPTRRGCVLPLLSTSRRASSWSHVPEQIEIERPPRSPTTPWKSLQRSRRIWPRREKRCHRSSSRFALLGQPQGEFVIDFFEKQILL